MSADIFRTSQLIIIMLNQKHSYLTFNKGGSKNVIRVRASPPVQKRLFNAKPSNNLFYIFYFLKEFAKVYEFVSSTATQDVAKCKQSLLPY